MELWAGGGAGAVGLFDPAALPIARRGGATARGAAAPQLLDPDFPIIDWLLEDGHGSPQCERESLWDLTLPPEAASTPVLASGVQWRCLDSTHAASCSRCKPAPGPDEAKRYHLVDTVGVQTEKRLRTLLARCAEWNDAAACARLAATLEAEEAASGTVSGMVELLRTHKLANMRKPLMLHLAYQWGYRSDCWQRRVGGGPRSKRQRTLAADSPEYAAAASAARGRREAEVEALNARPFTALHVAQGEVLQLITARVESAAHAWAGASSRGEFHRVQGAGMTWIRSFAMGGGLEVSRWTSGMCEMRLRTLRTWRDTLSAECLRAPAYAMDGAYNSPSSELEAVRFILLNSSAATHDTIPRLLQADGKLRPQDAAWIADYDAGHNLIMVLIASLQAIVTMQRQQPLSSYLEAVDAVLVGLCYYARKTTAALETRVEWTAAMAALQGPAAGDKLPSKAIIPPMVQRLGLNGGQGDLLALATSLTPLGQPPAAFSLCAQPPAAPR